MAKLGRIGHVFLPFSLFLGGVILVHHILPGLGLVGHEFFSVTNERAKRRGIERLASVDAGQCGIDEAYSVSDLLGLFGQAPTLRAKQGEKVDRYRKNVGAARPAHRAMA
ncbi:hypothetical protein GCM10022600_28600 [Qipengyuania pelagi]